MVDECESRWSKGTQSSKQQTIDWSSLFLVFSAGAWSLLPYLFLFFFFLFAIRTLNPPVLYPLLYLFSHTKPLLAVNHLFFFPLNNCYYPLHHSTTRPYPA